HLAAPSAPCSRPLVAESPYVMSPVVAHIPETRDIQACRPSPIIIAVFIPFDAATGTTAEMVIHRIMAKLAAAAPQPPFPYIRCGVHQHPGGVECRCAHKHHLGKIFVRL